MTHTRTHLLPVTDRTVPSTPLYIGTLVIYHPQQPPNNRRNIMLFPGKSADQLKYYYVPSTEDPSHTYEYMKFLYYYIRMYQ